MEDEPEARGPWKTFGRIAAILGLVGTVIGIVIGLDQLGLIDVPPGSLASPAERAAWSRIADSEDRCESLRAFLREHPSGAHANEAQTMLAARTERIAEVWAPYAMPSVVTGSSSLEHRATREAACLSARESARRNAENGCDIYRSDSARFRNMTMVMAEPECDCRDQAIPIEGPGAELIEPIWRCTVRSTYQCRGEGLQQQAQEYCGE